MSDWKRSKVRVPSRASVAQLSNKSLVALSSDVALRPKHDLNDTVTTDRPTEIALSEHREHMDHRKLREHRERE
jgi:hypothetical protein